MSVLQVMPLSICLCVFVVFPGTGWSGHSSGHQVCRQHPQGLCYITLHHPINSYIVLLAAGLRPDQVGETVTVFPSVSSLYIFLLLFFYLIIPVCQSDNVFCCCPQRVLPGGHFGHCGHFPVWLRRKAAPQPQQGIGYSQLTL